MYLGFSVPRLNTRMNETFVRYDIPRIQANMPGNQNRLANGIIRISPGMTEPVVFRMGNQDGVPLSLVGFSLKFVVWAISSVSENSIEIEGSSLILEKSVPIDDPHAGEAEMMLTKKETQEISNMSMGDDVRWSLLLVNADKEVFPLQAQSNGDRHGTIIVDSMRQFPISRIST